MNTTENEPGEAETQPQQAAHSNNNQHKQNSKNAEYMVYFTRRNIGTAADREPESRADYEIVMTADGDFAARRLDSGYVIAGFDHAEPELSIEDAAHNVYSQDDLYKIYVRGDFSTVMCRIINEYYYRLREKYNIWSKKAAAVRFPMGRIRPDHKSCLVNI